MELKDILNADLGEIGRWVRQGFVWWIDELNSLVPEGLRAGFSRRARFDVEFQAHGAGLRFWRDGRVVELAAPPRGAAARVGLLLARDQVLIREIDYPLLPFNDLRRMVALDIDRLTPFRADTVVADLEVLRRDADAGRQTVLLGVAPRAAAADAVARARAVGLEPVAIRGMASEDEARFDFLPALLAAEGTAPSARRLVYWQAAVVALLLLNVFALVFRDMADVNALSQTVDAQSATANIALRLRQNVERETARRRALLDRRARGEPMRVVNAVTRALPAGVWVQRLEWNGQSIRLVGLKTGEFDVPAAIRGSPAFTNPRALAMDASTRSGQGEPFDVVADAEKRLQR